MDKIFYLLAMERIPINDLEINTLLSSFLTVGILNNEKIMNGIVQYYYFERKEKEKEE